VRGTRKVGYRQGDRDMNRRWYATLILAAGMFLGGGGCTVRRVDLAEAGRVTVEKTSCRKTAILWTEIYQEGDDLMIYGTLGRKEYSGYRLDAHVDITLLASDGKVLRTGRTPDIRVPARRTGKGAAFTSFRERFAGVARSVSRVLLQCHSGPHT